VGTFAGVKISQYWDDLFIWEQFFNEHEIKTFIELGTDEGGMSLYLAMQCIQRNVHFHTFDHQSYVNFDSPLARIFGLKNAFHFVDLFSEEGAAQVQQIIDSFPHPLAIFFDNGNKPREWNIFVPMTHKGDYCIVHDWQDEFMPVDIADSPVKKIYDSSRDKPNIVLRTKYKTAWFRRT
jgi:cephalosporin hydroxylase